MIEFAAKTANFESYIARPAFVLSKDGGLMGAVMGALPSVRVDALASVLIDTAMNGSKLETFENKDLLFRAKELKQVKK